MIELIVPRQAQAQIIDFARNALPNEACGLLGGRITGSRHQTLYEVWQVSAIPNIAPTPATHFMMQPESMVNAMFALKRQHLEVVGIYHSHPLTDSTPSRIDIDEFYWGEIPYLIVGFAAAAPIIQAWQIEANLAVEVKIEV